MNVDVYKFNESFFQLSVSNDGILYDIKQHFSFKVDNFWFSPKYKAGTWDGSISMFNVCDRLLPTGLLNTLISFCMKRDINITYKFNIEDMYNNATIDDVYKFSEKLIQHTQFKIRDYQAKAVLNAINKKRGIVESPTGSGKSLIIYHIIQFIVAIQTNCKVLLTVPSTNLVRQMYGDFLSYGCNGDNICQIYFDEKQNVDLSKQIIISTWQSLQKKDDDYFKQFTAIMCDEAHHNKADILRKISQKCVNAEYRLGFTGTVPTSVADKYNIFSFLGTPIFNFKTHTLIEKGILSQIKIAVLLIQYSISDDEKPKTFDDEIVFIERLKKRNKVLSYILNIANNDENVLILCNHIKHLKIIVAYLQKYHKDKKIYTIHGNIKTDDREIIRKNIENDSGAIIVGTLGTMSTGVNIKKLHHIIAAASVKSRIKILQSIGRGLRQHDSKDKLIYWDIVDDFRYKEKRSIVKNYTIKHMEDRLKYYDSLKCDVVSKKINIDEL
jgi:superfamily II DNA or RNA helicase